MAQLTSQYGVVLVAVVYLILESQFLDFFSSTILFLDRLLPRLGDLVVLSNRNVVLGRTPEHHDLTVLHGGLRSHGGRAETTVPFIVSEPLTPEYAVKAAKDPRNFDIFDFTINGTHQ